MENVINIDSRRIPTLQKLYPLANAEIVAKKGRLIPIAFKQDEIEKYDVLFFYRLMKKNYGRPPIIEITDTNVKDLSKKYYLYKTGQGYTVEPDEQFYGEESKFISRIYQEGLASQTSDWKYYIETKSGSLLHIGTKYYHTSMLIAFFIPEDEPEPDATKTREAHKFICDLLAEAKRLEDQLLNPKKEFETGEGGQIYTLYNVYLDRYRSAELMLAHAKGNESEIRRKGSKYDARTKEWEEPIKREHITKYTLAAGMYYEASIFYYFMALEGFINLIYHAFLKDDLRDREFNLEQTLDLEQKIRLVPALCCGFGRKYIDPGSEIFRTFKKLKKYRNQLFHSRIVDFLMSIRMFEDGFFYSCTLGKNKETSFPTFKLKLKKAHVMEIKKIVDNIIANVLERAEVGRRKVIQKHLMKDPLIPFFKDKNGKITLSFSRKDHGSIELE